MVLAVLLLEAVVLFSTRRRHRLGALDILGQLVAGGLLLLALRCALTGADVRWVAGLVTLALPASLYDLARRIRERR